MFKDFDNWNNFKKIIDQKIVDESVFFHEREVWWGSLGTNIGIEANGKNELYERPLLIIKVFNKDMVWCLPVTSTLKDSPYYFRVKIFDQDQSVMITQIRTIDTKRLHRKLTTIDEGDFNEIKYLITSVLNETPAFGGGISEAEATNTSIILEPCSQSQSYPDLEVD